MAPPAMKRRKLEHSSDEWESEDGATEQYGNGVTLSNESLSEDENGSGDAVMDEAETFNNESTSEAGSEEEGEADTVIQPEKKTSFTKKANKVKPHDNHGAQLSDGVYTAETFKSNAFKLQVDELLEQVKPKYGKKEAPAENAMRALKGIIEQIPDREPMLIPEAQKTLKAAGITVPFPSPRPPKDAKYRLQYERPSTINVTGSYALKTATRTTEGLAIDLLVTMPKTIFQEKDYLNHRYFYKRAYYLACLAAGINDSKEHNFKLSFDCLNGNQLQPIIVVRPSGDGGADDFSSSNCRIHIQLSLAEGTFPETKLLPKANCVRPKATDDDTSSKPLAPTPFYNSTLQSDITITSYLRLLHSTLVNCDAFKDGCILGRIWLRQRGFGSRLRKGGFGNYEWTALMALLLQSNPGTGKPILSPGYSSYQLFKATLQFLARNDLTKKPFTFQARDVAFPKTGLAPVFFDGPRSLNILFKMNPWSYSKLQLEAKITVDMLGDSLFDQFDSTFILKTDLPRYRYDALLDVPLSTLGLNSESKDYEEELMGTCQKIHSTLTRALTDRITAVGLSLPDTSEWPTSTAKASENQLKRILIGFATNPENAQRTVDHGPSAENKQEAASFRKFWGDKSELRRFKDGSILESVVWSSGNASAPVIEQISSYILKRHLSVELALGAIFTSDSFANQIASGCIQAQSGISAFTPIMNAFAAVEKDIRALEDLPLQVRHIRAADAQLRYSSVEIPRNTPASIVVQFEASARWPDDLCAIQRTKTAFLLKLSELLVASQPGYVARVGLENPSQPSQNQAYLDITVTSGFIFRLRIHHDREPTLLERQLKDKTLDLQSRESAAVALGFYKRDFIQVLSHTQAIQNICTRCPALSPTIRLTKRWFASHLLSSHFSPELIELLVVRTFLQPHPWPVPSCATTGFLRTLAWIARWDWRHIPLIVDFSSNTPADPTDPEGARKQGMKADSLEKIQTRFEAWRRIDPAMNRVVLFAATNLDLEGNTWTDRAKPAKVVASRMTALARAATNAVRAEEDTLMASVNGQEVISSGFKPDSLFVPQVQEFDFVVQISAKFAKPTKKKKVEPKFKNIENQQTLRDSKDPDIEPALLFVQDLQDIYGDAILFFYDADSVDRIAGLWNPTVTGQRAFKVKAGWNSVPVKSRNGEKKQKSDNGSQGVDIQINKGAICNEIRRLGGEMISGIEVNNR